MPIGKKFTLVKMPVVLERYYRKYDFKNLDVFLTSNFTQTVDRRVHRSRDVDVKSAFKEFNKIINALKRMQSRCAICLEYIVRRCFLDKCLHSFCTVCVARWSEEKKMCPICGEDFVAVFYNVRSIRSYKIRKFGANRRPCLLKSMKNINSFYEIKQNVGRVFRNYKISVDGFCIDMARMR